MTGILDDRTILVTGVITQESIAFHVARVAQEQGARVVLTGYGRMSLVRKIAQRLPQPAPVVELDITDPGQVDSLAERLREHVDCLDGVLHTIAFAPQETMGGQFLNASWQDVAVAMHTSTYSLPALARGVRPLLRSGSSIVGLDFDAQVAWADYD